MNFPEVTYWATAALLALRWIPAFLIYNIDLSIWYALWSGFVGIYVGMAVKVGVVKNFDEIRSHMMDCPAAFCDKIIRFSPHAQSQEHKISARAHTHALTPTHNTNTPAHAHVHTHTHTPTPTARRRCRG